MDSWEKGRKAEKIVEKLFKEAGFRVIKYGYEHTVPELTYDKNGSVIKGEAADYIRHQPDFIIVNDKNEAFFIEVKFRSKYIKPQRDIFPYPKCYVVLLDKNFIYAQSTHYLFGKGGDFIELNKIPLFKDIDTNLIKKYTDKLRRDLGDETLLGQKVGSILTKLTKNSGVELVDKTPLKIKMDTNTLTTYKGNTYRKILDDKEVPSWVRTKLALFMKKYKGKDEYYFKGDYYHYICKLDGRNKEFYIRKKN